MSKANTRKIETNAEAPFGVLFQKHQGVKLK